jgi:type II restriction enzyme
MIKGNRGEWSELYTFFKLLADGKLYAADAQLVKLDDIFFPIVRIIRDETVGQRKYFYAGENVTVDINGNKFDVPSTLFSDVASHLLQEIKTAKGATFSVPKAEAFMNQIKVERLKDQGRGKADIIIQIYDPQTGFTPEVGFSIKSKLGKPATLFNAAKASNFNYEITGEKSDVMKITNDIVAIQGTASPSSTDKSKGLKEIIGELANYNCSLKYRGVDDRFNRNLMLTDSQMPVIIATMLFVYYSGQAKSNVVALTNTLIKMNPLNINPDNAELFYTHKVKNLLCDMALGMTATNEWRGTDDASGGYIVIKEDGDVVAYHILKRDLFKDYLFHNTRFDGPQRFDSLPPSKKKGYYYGFIYDINKKPHIDLCLQIRFT